MQTDELDATQTKSKMLRRLICSWNYEDRAREEHGAIFIAGTDEAGRGCLAGSCFAAAVILDRSVVIADDVIRDSKMLAPKKRDRIATMIMEDAVCYAIASVDASTIDHINIAEAAKLAMLKAIAALEPRPDFLLVDGIRLDHHAPQFVITHGDGVSFSIAAASILAKVAKNAEMMELAQLYPGYGFDSNMSYGTKEHLEALNRLGPSPVHRRSFRPVREAAKPLARSYGASSGSDDKHLERNLIHDALVEIGRAI